MVKDYIFPSMPAENIFDQYGFKSTGSTTAALVDITSTISIMLEENNYVRCLLIDFSKAFDSVNHILLVSKLKLLNLPENIIQWVVLFLIDREQFTKIGDRRSATRIITRSIARGSVSGLLNL